MDACNRFEPDFELSNLGQESAVKRNRENAEFREKQRLVNMSLEEELRRTKLDTENQLNNFSLQLERTENEHKVNDNTPNKFVN